MDKQQQEKLIEIIRQTLARDDALREKYDVKNKFRFVHDRLLALLAHLEKDLQVIVIEKEKQKVPILSADEQIVYVYLFNAHGHILRTWQNMLIPKVFYEYSVNRPIYGEKDHVENVVRAKANRTQHGYLVIAVNKMDIFKYEGSSSPKDVYGNIIFKVKEGSLAFNRLISFVHNGIEYSVSEQGELFKKSEE
ncbi:MAG: type IVB secretion system protein IcmQ [Gammaproteobacteria bacterium]|nr:type IVB secretion system protein IcmQ [Gammaproteobacteria bacterium]